MTHIEVFKEKFGYGYFRPTKSGYEVRVKDLDFGLENARKVIQENDLSLEITSRDVRLRSFEIRPKS